MLTRSSGVAVVIVSAFTLKAESGLPSLLHVLVSALMGLIADAIDRWLKVAGTLSVHFGRRTTTLNAVNPVSCAKSTSLQCRDCSWSAVTT